MKIETHGLAKVTGWDALLIVLTGGVWVAVPALKVLLSTEKHEIANNRLESTRGRLSKVHDTLDLRRVKDVRLSQGFIGRALNYATLEVFSTDKTHKTLIIKGVKDPMKVRETLLNGSKGATIVQ